MSSAAIVIGILRIKRLACWVKIPADSILKCFSYFSKKTEFDSL